MLVENVGTQGGHGSMPSRTPDADMRMHIVRDCCFFPPNELLVKHRAEKEAKRQALMKELESFKNGDLESLSRTSAETKAASKTSSTNLLKRAAAFDLSLIPASEIEQGHGPTLEAELKWQRFLRTPFVAKHPSRLGACGTLISDVIHPWRLDEAARLRLAYTHLMSEALVKKVAYAVTHGSIVAEVLGALYNGEEQGRSALVVEIERWKQEQWVPATKIAEEQTGDGSAQEASAASGHGDGSAPPCINGNTNTGVQASAVTASSNNVPLPLLPHWLAHVKLPHPKAGKLSDTVRESAQLFLEGNSVDAVAVKRSKQIAPSTVEGHLLTAFMNGVFSPQSGDVLERIRQVCLPSGQQWQQIEAAFAAADVDWSSGKDTKLVVEQLGADSSWYSKIRWYKCLRELEYPIEEGLTAASVPTSGKGPALEQNDGEEEAAKRRRIMAAA
ncbi:unnamed protein product [Amoebophrya sp. A25]|nr:unnamed protein product [Amoebophrya sp. A25]|eukprot:GSA25T00018517001.1